MKYNLLPKDKIKKNYGKYINATALVLLLVMGGVLYKENVHKSQLFHEIFELDQTSQNYKSNIELFKNKLENNLIFKDLRIGKTYQIKERVSLNQLRYSDLLGVIYNEIPPGIKIQSIVFGTEKGTLEITGQTAEYPNLMIMFTNFYNKGLGKNPTFSSIAFDSKNMIVNFIFKCEILPESESPKKVDDSKINNNTSPGEKKETDVNVDKPSDTLSVNSSEPSQSQHTSLSTISSNAQESIVFGEEKPPIKKAPPTQTDKPTIEIGG